MLPRRALLALVLLLVLPAASARAADVRPVLNGGQLTYEGTAFAKEDIDGSWRHHETANLAWSTTYVLNSPYAGSPRLVSGDKGWDDPLSWQSDLGDWSGWSQTWDSDKKQWGEVNNCGGHARTTLAHPNPLPPPDDQADGTFKQPIYASQDIGWKGSCSDPDWGSDSPLMHNELINNVPATFTLPKAMKAGVASIKQDIANGYPTRSCDFETGCTQSLSVTGTATLKCLLCVSKIDFEHPDQPTGTMKTVPSAGTTDGNIVKVRVQVTNSSPHAFTSLVSLREAKSGRTLYSIDWANTQPITFAAGATKTLTYYWNTDGFAWEKGQPASDRTIQVLTGAGGGEADIKVLPRPMIMVHGWNANAATWDAIKPQVPTLVHPGLAGRVFAVGDGQAIGAMNTDPQDGWPIERNARAEKDYVEDVRQDLDAAHVDLVAHSMGGLISRMYVQERMPEPTATEVTPMVAWPVARHLVMIGTPNEGSPCADLITMVAGGVPSWQLRPDYAAGFNKVITDRRAVKMSVMAGDWEERTCQSPEHGDLVVEVPSAWSTFEDVAKTYINHMDMTGSAAIMGGWVRDHVGEDPDQALNANQHLPAARESLGAGLTAGRAMAPRVGAPERRASSSVAAVAEQEIALAQSVTVPAGGSVDVALPQAPAKGALTVGFLAPAGVASALVRPDGSVADAVAAGSDAARQPMRFHRAERPTAGVWKLRLSQSGGAGVAVGVAAALEGDPLRLTAAAEADAAGLKVSATLRDGGAGVSGATLTARLRASEQADREVTLHDDGDGSYSTTVTGLASAEWTVRVEAHHGAKVRYAGAVPGGVASPGGDGDGDGDGPGDGDGGGGDHPGDGGDHSGDGNGDGNPGDVPSPGDGSGGDAPNGNGSAPGGPTAPGPSPAGPGAPNSGSTKGSGAAKSSASARLRATASPARDRRAPYAFTVRGTVSGAHCARTKVTLTLTGRRPVTVTATAKCAFRATVKATKKGRFTITVKASGNATKKLAVRAG